MLVILFQFVQLIVVVGLPVAALAWLGKEFLSMRRELRVLAARIDVLASHVPASRSMPPNER